MIETRYDGASASPFSKVKIAWSYDAMNRLIAETRDADPTPADGEDNWGSQEGEDYTDAFAYDLAGNRMAKAHDAAGTANDEMIAYTYNGRDQLLAEGPDTDADGVPDSATATTYAYDANGSQTGKTDSAGTTTYTWDLRGRLLAVDAPGTADDASYAYDSDGVRVGKSVNGVSTTYLIDEQNPTGYAKAIEERDGSGVLTRSYVLGQDIVAQANTGSSPMLFLKDGHVATRALLDDVGQILAGQSFDFTAFGDPVGFDPATAATDWLAPDGRTDGESGLIYSLARYRDGWRFVSADDPLYGNAEEPLSLHKYLYAHANPIWGTDPSGHSMACTIGAGAMWLGEAAQAAGMASMVTGLAMFVISAANYYGASLGLAMTDAGVGQTTLHDFLRGDHHIDSGHLAAILAALDLKISPAA